MTTGACEGSISSSTSKPSSLGIWTSRKSRSGLVSAMAFTASNPLAHSATTMISGCEASNSRRYPRASSSSSTRTAFNVCSMLRHGSRSPRVQISYFRRVYFVRQWITLNLSRATGKGRRSGRRIVSHKAETPFDSIEGSHEYVRMLAEAVNAARRDVEEEIAAAEQDRADRRKEALLLVSYNLAKLNLHITSSRRILNDLRSLRRLLLAERGLSVEDESEVGASD